MRYETVLYRKVWNKTRLEGMYLFILLPRETSFRASFSPSSMHQHLQYMEYRREKDGELVEIESHGVLDIPENTILKYVYETRDEAGKNTTVKYYLFRDGDREELEYERKYDYNLGVYVDVLKIDDRTLVVGRDRAYYV